MRIKVGLLKGQSKVALGPDGLKGVSTNGFCVVEARGDKNCRGRSELLIPARSLAV